MPTFGIHRMGQHLCGPEAYHLIQDDKDLGPIIGWRTGNAGKLELSVYNAGLQVILVDENDAQSSTTVKGLGRLMKPNTFDLKLGRRQELHQEDGTITEMLPEIFGYWADRYIAPGLKQVFNSESLTEIYIRAFERTILADTEVRRKFACIGPDFSEAFKVCKGLLDKGLNNFSIFGLFSGTEITRIEEARLAIASEGLAQHFFPQIVDLNYEGDVTSFNGVMAHFSLHNIVNLGEWLGFIERSLTTDGHFIACGMIGRNGHMSWPETLQHIERIWNNLGDLKKYHWQFRKTHPQFLNWDCSRDSSEGIRAQDVLPLLLQHFSFEAFFASGGIIDPFVGRGYGPNFDIDNPKDRDFIRGVGTQNDELIDAGKISPTMMFADMVKRNKMVVPRIFKTRSPLLCIRYPDAPEHDERLFQLMMRSRLAPPINSDE